MLVDVHGYICSLAGSFSFFEISRFSRFSWQMASHVAQTCTTITDHSPVYRTNIAIDGLWTGGRLASYYVVRGRSSARRRQRGSHTPADGGAEKKIRTCRNIVGALHKSTRLHVPYPLTHTAVPNCGRYEDRISGEQNWDSLPNNYTVRMYYGSGTVDIGLSAIAGSWRRWCIAPDWHSPDGNTFLREITSRLPSWKCDVKSKIRFRHSICI